MLFLLPILISPYFVLVTVLVGIGISIVGFVKGCLLAGKQGSFVAFDYLTALGPLRWIVLIGFFGLYVMGYLLLWLIAQVSAASHRPKWFLPWFGLQALGFVIIFLGMITAFLSDAFWQKGRNPQPESHAEIHHPNRESEKREAVPPVQAPGVGAEAKVEDAPPAAAPVMTGDPELDQTLANLGAKDGAVRKAAADRLLGMKPNPHRPVVAKKIAENLQTAELWERTPLIRALGVWATPAEVPFLLQFLRDPDINTRNEVLDVLGKLRDERAVKPVVSCFMEFNTRWHAEQALKKLGPMAEKEVLALLSQPNKDMRVPAIYVLAEIGTEQSLPALQEATKEFATKGVAEGAIAAIKKRMQK
jgi:hypothetical protein